MSNIFGEKAINASGESLPTRALRGLGRIASCVFAPLDKYGPTEATSFFDAPEPKNLLTDELDRLDAVSDEEIMSAKMSHIEIHKTQE